MGAGEDKGEASWEVENRRRDEVAEICDADLDIAGSCKAWLARIFYGRWDAEEGN